MTTTTAPPLDDLLELLRRCGTAYCLAGEAASRIPEEMEAIADAYGVGDCEFLVVPTGVFVRIVDNHEGGVTVDFMNADGPPLRLDQIDAFYKLVEQIKRDPIPPDDAIDKLQVIIESKPRFNWFNRMVGHAILTVGLGLLLVRDRNALIALAGLGLVIGLLRIIGDRIQVLSLALPVAAAMLVAGLAYEYSYTLGVEPSTLIIPPLVTFLPGAALALGAQEMATRSMISGASRIVYGVYVLLLLSFGLLAGSQIAGPPQNTPPIDTFILPGWVPAVGVLVFGIGLYVNSSAPKRSFFWLILMLFAAWGAQKAGGYVADGLYGLFGAFTGGLVVVPIATLVQKLKGPPAQVASLPAFWLLVPGALGLAGVANLVEQDTIGVSGTPLVIAFLTVIAVALGMLVGSSLTSGARASSRLFTARASKTARR